MKNIDKETLHKAALWDALTNSVHLRTIGWSGLRDDDNGPTAHLGLELWTHHEPTPESKRGADLLTKLVEKQLANLAAQENIKLFIPCELKDQETIVRAKFEGEKTQIDTDRKTLGGELITYESLLSYAKAWGLCEDLTVVFTREDRPSFINGLLLLLKDGHVIQDLSKTTITALRNGVNIDNHTLFFVGQNKLKYKDHLYTVIFDNGKLTIDLGILGQLVDVSTDSLETLKDLCAKIKLIDDFLESKNEANNG